MSLKISYVLKKLLCHALSHFQIRLLISCKSEGVLMNNCKHNLQV